MKTRMRLLLFALIACTATPAFSDSGYRLVKKIPIAGDGAWDYIGADNANRHIFVSHGSQVEVLDADTDAIVGKIVAPGVDPFNSETLTGQGTRGGTAAPELGRGFTSNGRDGSVSIFDLKTLKVLNVVKVGENPDGYVYDPASRRGFTFSNRTKGAAAVDIAEAKLAGTVDLGGKPEAAAADGKGHVFVNIQDKDLVKKIDSRKLVVEESWPTAPCHQPTSMAIDPKTRRIFVGCRDKDPILLVMNSENGKIITTLPIGSGTDAAAFDPGARLVFTSNGEGSITVVQEESADKFRVIDTVKTEPGARTMALDLKTHKIFLCVADRAPAQQGARAELVPGTFRVLVVAKSPIAK